jgi:hypothetical protein
VRAGIGTYNEYPEPEFLNILKCNSAESASTGFQFNDILNDETPTVIIGFQPLFRSVKIDITQFLFYYLTKTEACTNPVVLSDL